MADHSMEQDLGLLSMNQKSMVVTIGNIPVDILRAYEAQKLSRFGGQRKRKSKSKSAPRKDGKPRRTKMGRPRKASVLAEREAEQARQAASLPTSPSVQADSSSPYDSDFGKDFIVLSDHTIPLEVDMAYEGLLGHIHRETRRHLQLNVSEKAQLEEQLAQIETVIERAGGTPPATPTAPAVRSGTGSVRAGVDGYGELVSKNMNDNNPDVDTHVSSSSRVIRVAQAQNVDITTLPVSSFSSLPANTRLDRLVRAHHPDVPDDAQVQPARTGYFDTDALNWNYDTTITNDVSHNPLFVPSPSPGQILDNSQLGLNLMRMNDANAIDPQLFYPRTTWAEFLQSTMPDYLNFADAPISDHYIDTDGNAHIGFGTSTHPGYIINMDEVNATLAAPSSFTSRASLTDSPQFTAPQTPEQFHQDQLLSSARIARRNMTDTRKGRAKFRKMVANHCEAEVHARETSRGRYVQDEDLNDSYQVIELDENGDEVDQPLTDLGFRRENTNYAEGNHWKTAEEWDPIDTEKRAQQVELSDSVDDVADGSVVSDVDMNGDAYGKGDGGWISLDGTFDDDDTGRDDMQTMEGAAIGEFLGEVNFFNFDV